MSGRSGRGRGTLPALLVGLVVLALGLTTYTQSVFNPGPAQTLEQIFQAALGDSLPVLPAWAGSRTGLQISPGDSAPARSAGVAGGPAAAWVADAVERDSTAIRGWLSPFVLRWANRSRDTVHLTFIRFYRHAGCPLLNRLEATLTDEPLEAGRLLGIRATCPATPAPQAVAAPRDTAPQ